MVPVHSCKLSLPIGASTPTTAVCVVSSVPYAMALRLTPIGPSPGGEPMQPSSESATRDTSAEETARIEPPEAPRGKVATRGDGETKRTS